MTFRQAKREIEALGWRIIATTSFTDGLSYDATNGKKLAKGSKEATTELAMNALYRVVLFKA